MVLGGCQGPARTEPFKHARCTACWRLPARSVTLPLGNHPSLAAMPYRPTVKTAARKAEIRQRLLNCAMHIVASEGFGALTVGALANDAGIATGAVYKHFESKAQLCAEVFRIATEKEVALVRETAGGSGTPTQRLLDAIAVFSHRAMRGQRLAYALIAEPVDPAVDAERLRYRRAYAEIFQELVEEGMRLGEFPAQIASVSAAALVGVIAEALVGPLARPYSDSAALDDIDLVRSIQAFCLRAVALHEPQ
jgi:AcrR family transcriptional regulator